MTALEEKMAEICELMDDYMPDQYKDRTIEELSRDPLGKAWRYSMQKFIRVGFGTNQIDNCSRA